ncbi:MAG: type II toxin-antitoxin system Phd/YefM family antitoxin [Thermoleophilia bacterium]|nr:type II toxin-antitoxin system Phd/YefM family antitoxin [Thermoleophilia bacterium]
MRTITATELARNLRQVLDQLVSDQEEIVVERNQQQVALILPVPGRQTALEAMADLYRTLPEDAAAGWLDESRRRGALSEEARDPWGTHGSGS